MGLKYEDIKPVFLSRLERDREATALMASIESGSATYATATQYAARVGEILGQVLKFNAPITDISDWDIDDLIPGSLGLDHRIVTNACRAVQETMNRDAGIGIRYQEPTFDWDRVHGIVDELRDNPEFINIEETFYDQITNFSQNVVDSSVRANASVASGAGIKTYVIRTASANACQWCQDAAGQYDYESVKNTGDPVWLRHENCNCTIDYVTERNGQRYRERVYEGQEADIGTLKEGDSIANTEFLNGLESDGKIQHSSRYAVRQNYENSADFREKIRNIAPEGEGEEFRRRAGDTLRSRSGSNGEDLHFYDINTNRWSSNTSSTEASRVGMTNEMMEMVNSSTERHIIGIHNHPASMPPSVDDLNCAYAHRYAYGVIVGHDGTVYTYTPPIDFIPESSYSTYYQSGIDEGMTELDAQFYALNRLSEVFKFKIGVQR